LKNEINPLSPLKRFCTKSLEGECLIVGMLTLFMGNFYRKITYATNIHEATEKNTGKKPPMQTPIPVLFK
jgi:hypothetical protein